MNIEGWRHRDFIGGQPASSQSHACGRGRRQRGRLESRHERSRNRQSWLCTVLLIHQMPPDQLGDEYEALYRAKMGGCGSFHALTLVVLAGGDLDRIYGFDWKQAGLHSNLCVCSLQNSQLSLLPTPDLLLTGPSPMRNGAYQSRGVD